MISHDHKCIFVQIPKTGGASIEFLLWPGERRQSDLWMGLISKYRNKYQTGGLQNLCAGQIRNEVGRSMFKEYFKFSFVRNPWGKAVSRFSYLKKRDDLREYIGMKENDTFTKYLELIQNKSHVQWSPQHKFITDSNGQCLVDYIGMFETFERDVLNIMERLGLSVQKIPHMNKSDYRPYFEHYDHESVEMVRDLYRDDIEMFNYSFPL